MGTGFGVRPSATVAAILAAGVFASALVLGSPKTGETDDPSTDVETRVRRLVEKMTDPSEQVRDRSYESLKAIGEPALETLRKLAKGESEQATAARRGLYAIRPEAMRKPPGGKGGRKDGQKGIAKATMADSVRANIYADNWFILYINGKLTAVDSIDFLPHNVVSVDILPEYPMTIAVLVKDNANPKTGLEYGDHIGDGGFILRFGDGTVTSAKWKAKSFFHGPIDHDLQNPRVRREPLPKNWWAVDFDDNSWEQATEYTEERVGPKEHFYKYDFHGARWIWSKDLDLDNTVVFRYRVEKPGRKPRWNTKPEIDVTGALPWEKDQ